MTIYEREREIGPVTAPVGVDAISECLEGREQATAREALAKGNAYLYLDMFLPQHRFAAYWQVRMSLAANSRAQHLRNVWGYDLQPGSNAWAWRRELAMCAKYPKDFMSTDDLATFNNLPLTVTVFRAPGWNEGTPKGFSWTFCRNFAEVLSSDRSESKAERFIFQAECEPHRAVGCLLDEDANYELVIFPEEIKAWERRNVGP